VIVQYLIEADTLTVTVSVSMLLCAAGGFNENAVLFSKTCGEDCALNG